MEDGRCKLGLLGRLELVMLIEQGSTLRAGRGGPERRAGDGASLVASLAGRQSRPSARRGRVCARARRGRGRARGRSQRSEEQAILTAARETNWGPMQLDSF